VDFFYKYQKDLFTKDTMFLTKGSDAFDAYWNEQQLKSFKSYFD